MSAISESPTFDGNFKHFTAVPTTPTIGATIEGLHLSELNDESGEELRQALWQYGVLFAREQHLSPEDHKRVASLFGDELEKHPVGPVGMDDIIFYAGGLSEEHPEIARITAAASDLENPYSTDSWHHDETYREHPTLVNVLQAKDVVHGCDTMWASMSGAYDLLPDELKLLFLGLDLDHDFLFSALRHGYGNPRQIVEYGEAQTYPAVVQHYASGRLCLFAGEAFAKRVHDYPTDLSEAILKIIFELPKIPELQVRHQWRPGDIAIWDNFATTHYGITRGLVRGDIGAQKRELHRVSAFSPSIRPSLDRDKAVSDLLRAMYPSS